LLRDDWGEVGKPRMLLWNLSIGSERPELSHKLVQTAAICDASKALGSARRKHAVGHALLLACQRCRAKATSSNGE
jgi:hypothetical protein